MNKILSSEVIDYMSSESWLNNQRIPVAGLQCYELKLLQNFYLSPFALYFLFWPSINTSRLMTSDFSKPNVESTKVLLITFLR